MPSPFPGMDPYLEGHLWPDVHHCLATEIRRALTPLIRPRYVARVDVQIVEDGSPEAEIGIMYPDVEVLRRRAGSADEPGPGAGAAIRAPVTIPVLHAVEVRVATVEVRDAASNELVTSIEIVSPVNKRKPGLERYREKRRRLGAAGVHLLEIDLLRRGTRSLADHPRCPTSDYLVSLARAGAGEIELWPIGLRDPLPEVPVPLRAPDPDVSMHLGKILTTIYDESAYELSVDYDQPPPEPALSPELWSWARERISG